jgi:GNAT superfamily N-acetyltransferase
MASQTQATTTADILVRPLQKNELAEADHIFRLAFGTYLGLPDPTSFYQGADYIRTRWMAEPGAAFAAEIDGRLAGTNFATSWGSVGFFGPLTIHPTHWDHGVGKRLMEPIMDLFFKWGTKHAGLFTFAHSQKHVGLYQKFGFWPRFLTAIMALPVKPSSKPLDWRKFSELPEEQRRDCLRACQDLTNEIYEGLNVEREIRAVENQKLGDTVLLWSDSELVGLAVCHCGAGSEAGPEACYVKFGAVRPGPNSAESFDRLLSACEALAVGKAMSKLIAGVNCGRTEAYQQMIARGFSTEIQGVTMHRPNEAGYSEPGVFVIDDWR